MKALRVFLIILAVLPAAPLARAADLSAITIRTADGRILPFKVELALTPEQSRLGLMNRASLPADQGMLFDFHAEQPVYMWMKNTLIPLDMIFIAGDGHVAGIAERTVPLSEAIIASPGAVRGVLEVNGGVADRLHITVGDRVDNPLFGKK